MDPAKDAKVINAKPAKEISAKNAKELDELSHRIIGIAIEVHKKLGPGFQEKIYEGALLRELEQAGLTYEKQKVIRVNYGNVSLGHQRVDLFVDKEIILEIKACSGIVTLHLDRPTDFLSESR